MFLFTNLGMICVPEEALEAGKEEVENLVKSASQLPVSYLSSLVAVMYRLSITHTE